MGSIESLFRWSKVKQWRGFSRISAQLRNGEPTPIGPSNIPAGAVHPRPSAASLALTTSACPVDDWWLALRANGESPRASAA
jgi:hypothetical protein